MPRDLRYLSCLGRQQLGRNDRRPFSDPSASPPSLAPVALISPPLNFPLITYQQAEAVSRSLEVPVLIHGSKKPSPRCAMDVARYFSPRQKDASYPPVPVVFSPRHRSAEARWDSGRTKERETGRVKVLVVGDRLTTDIILASRLTKILSPPPSLLSRLLKSKGKAKQSEGEENEVTVVSVLTDRIWARERLGTRTMRWMEERMLRYAMWVEGRGGDASALKRRRREWEDCVRSTSLPSSPAPSSTPSPGTWLRGLSTSRLDIPRSLSSSFARFVQERLRRAVEEGRRWYDGGLGCGVRRPEGVRRLESWKRM